MPTIRRPSPALIVSILALGIASTGSASAHTVATIAHQISGSSLKPHSVAGSRLKNNTVTGKQIKESSLGTVPSATTLSGIPASGFVQPIATQVIKTLSTTGAFEVVDLPGLGTIYGTCDTSAGLEYDNTTTDSQDVNVTFVDQTSGASGSPIYDFHGPWSPDHGVTHAVSGAFSANIEGLTTGSSPQMIRLTVTANVTGGNCIFDAIGDTTL